jgi:hypothetical protein
MGSRPPRAGRDPHLCICAGRTRAPPSCWRSLRRPPPPARRPPPRCVVCGVMRPLGTRWLAASPRFWLQGVFSIFRERERGPAGRHRARPSPSIFNFYSSWAPPCRIPAHRPPPPRAEGARDPRRGDHGDPQAPRPPPEDPRRRGRRHDAQAARPPPQVGLQVSAARGGLVRQRSRGPRGATRSRGPRLFRGGVDASRCRRCGGCMVGLLLSCLTFDDFMTKPLPDDFPTLENDTTTLTAPPAGRTVRPARRRHRSFHTRICYRAPFGARVKATALNTPSAAHQIRARMRRR